MLNAADLKKAVSLRESGYTYQAIADELNTDLSNVYRSMSSGTRKHRASARWKRKTIASKMIALNMSMEDLARKTNMKLNSLYLVVRGDQDPKLTQALRIADALDLTLEEAFSDVVS